MGCHTGVLSRGPHLILASASPRRRALLSLLGLPFKIAEAGVEERRLEGESPREMTVRLSKAKAEAVASRLRRGIVIASDTIVVLGDEVLGKPAGPEEAMDMLRRLRGREHKVYSGLALLEVETGRLYTACDQTCVYMRSYSDEEIAAYVATGDPLDKAGAYAIQDATFHPVARIEGCYASVMGLPLGLVAQALRAFSLPVPDDEALAAACSAFTGHPCCLSE